MSIYLKEYSVLQILPHLNSGGLVNGAIEISKSLCEKGIGSFIASSGGTRAHEIIRGGAKNFNLPLGKKNPYHIYRNISRIETLIKQNKIDIVHARSRAPAWSTRYAASKMKIPFVTTFHGTYGLENYMKKKYNNIMTSADKVIAISEFIAKHITKEYGTDRSKICIIPRGVDLSVFSSSNVKEAKLYDISDKYNLKDEFRTILLPGRMTRWKGHDIFIEAIAMLKMDNILCMFVGDVQNKNRYVKELQNKIKKLGLSDKFRFLGHQRDMAAVYKLADVVVSASTKPEAFGRIVAEAQAMGRLTIAANHGASPEIIRHKETGWLFKSGNAKDLAAKIRLALSLNEEERNTLSEKSVDAIKNNFDVKFMCEKTLKLYSDLLEEKKRKF